MFLIKDWKHDLFDFILWLPFISFVTIALNFTVATWQFWILFLTALLMKHSGDLADIVFGKANNDDHTP